MSSACIRAVLVRNLDQLFTARALREAMRKLAADDEFWLSLEELERLERESESVGGRTKALAIAAGVKWEGS